MSLSRENPQEAGRRSFRLVDWGLPLFTAITGAALVLESLTLPIFEQYTGLGAGFMPLAIGMGLLLVAAGLFWQVWQGARFEPDEAEGADASSPPSLSRLGLAALAVLTPIASFPLLGFPLGAAISFLCVTRAFGSRRWALDLVIGVVLASGAWFAFSKLGVQLGPFLPPGLR